MEVDCILITWWRIVNETGFSNIWQTQNFKSTEWLKQSIKQTLLDQFLQDWNSSVRNSFKAFNYRIFKTDFKGVSMIRVDFGPISETVHIDIILNKIIERKEKYFLFMISLCPLLLSNVNGGGSN